MPTGREMPDQPGRVMPVGPRALEADFKAQLLGLLQLLRALPSPLPRQARPSATAAPVRQDGPLYTPSGRLDGAMPSALPTAGTPGEARRSVPGDAAAREPGLPLRELTRLVEGALARTRVHQFAALPEVRAGGENAPLASWVVEVPLQRGEHLDLLELRIEEHRSRNAGDGPGARLWQLMMCIEIEPLGALHAWLNLAGSRLSATLWAERSATLDAARAALGTLAEALALQGVEVERLECVPGRPREEFAPLFERLLDVRT